MRAPAHTCQVPPAPTRTRRLFCASSQPSVLPWLCLCVFVCLWLCGKQGHPLALTQQPTSPSRRNVKQMRMNKLGDSDLLVSEVQSKHAHSSLPIHHPLACPETPPLIACSANTRVEMRRFQAQKNASVERCCVICFALPHLPHRTTTTSTTTTMWRCPTPTWSPTPHRLPCICSSFPSQEILGGPLGFWKCSAQPD